MVGSLYEEPMKKARSGIRGLVPLPVGGSESLCWASEYVLDSFSWLWYGEEEEEKPHPRSGRKAYPIKA